MSLESEELLNRQSAIARIAGAIAHELNNPLQGVLSLSTLSTGDRGFPVRERLELIRGGLLRLSQIVESLSALYENLPRPPGEATVGDFLHLLSESFAERNIRTSLEAAIPPGTMITVLIPEIVRLIREAFSLPSRTDSVVQIKMDLEEGGAVLTCERESSDTAEPWCGLSGHHVCSGLAVLIDELTKLAGGESEFRFDHASLSGIKLGFRTRMN